LGLAAGATINWVVWAHVESVDPPAICTRTSARRWAWIASIVAAATIPRPIADWLVMTMIGMARVLRLPSAFEGARQQHKFVDGFNIVGALDIERTVPVKQDGVDHAILAQV
jgi:hypothetical protein